MIPARIRNFCKFAWRKQLMIIEAAIWLILARVAIRLPFRWLVNLLGGQGQQSGNMWRSQKHHDVAVMISSAVCAVAETLPWRSKCLEQALAAVAMLAIRRLPHTLYLGLRKGEANLLQAHAWLRSGPKILTGRNGAGQHKTILSFGKN